MPNSIVVRNAQQHNLKGFTVSFPRRQLTVVTGPSGSGKSSLAFDTLYAEGQRRYVESLSTYAKQFLERMPKPDVESVEGISPAVAIEQKNPTTSSRSTVGTATEIYDYLRLLWARIGRPHCTSCGERVVSESPSTATERLITEFGGRHLLITFPLPRSEHPDHDLLLENLMAMGFVRIMVKGEVHRLDELPPNLRLDSADVSVLVDRVKATPAMRSRLADSLAVAFTEGDGLADVVIDETRRQFSQRPRCAACGKQDTGAGPVGYRDDEPICDLCLLEGSTDLGMALALIAVTRAYGSMEPGTSEGHQEALEELGMFARIYHRIASKSWPARLFRIPGLTAEDDSTH